MYIFVCVLLTRLAAVESNLNGTLQTNLNSSATDSKLGHSKEEQTGCLNCNGTLACLSNGTFFSKNGTSSSIGDVTPVDCLHGNNTKSTDSSNTSEVKEGHLTYRGNVNKSRAFRINDTFPSKDVSSQNYLHGNDSVDNVNTSVAINRTSSPLKRPRSAKVTSFVIFLTIIKVVLFIVGVTGNVMVVMTIFTTKSMQNLQNYFVLNLAVTDLVTLILYLPLNIKESFDPTWPFGEFACMYLLPVLDIVPPVSVLTMVAISIDRYRAITSTLSRNLTVKSTVLLLVSLWVGCYLVVGLPVSFFMKLSKKAVCIADFTSVVTSRAYYTLRSVLLYVIPSLSIFFCYLRVNKTLGNSMRFLKRSVTGKSQVIRLKRQKRVMSMFFAIFVTFAVCYFPFNVIMLIFNYVKFTKTNLKFFKYSVQIAQIFGLANSVCNPIILYCLSHAYRIKFQSYIPFLKWCTHLDKDLTKPTQRSTTSEVLASTPDHQPPQNNRRRLSSFSLAVFSTRNSWMKRLHRINTNRPNFEQDKELLENNNTGAEEIPQHKELTHSV